MSRDKVQLIQFLEAIELGLVKLKPMSEPHEIYNGLARYHCSNDWLITIFIDCGEWDYVDEIVTAQGVVFDFAHLDALGLIDEYEPSADVIVNNYGIK